MCWRLLKHCFKPSEDSANQPLLSDGGEPAITGIDCCTLCCQSPSDSRIYMCSNNHVLCSVCVQDLGMSHYSGDGGQSCPLCRCCMRCLPGGDAGFDPKTACGGSRAPSPEVGLTESPAGENASVAGTTPRVLHPSILVAGFKQTSCDVSNLQSGEFGESRTHLSVVTRPSPASERAPGHEVHVLIGEASAFGAEKLGQSVAVEPQLSLPDDCAVCFSRPSKPRLLPCGNGHVFCLACIQGLMENNRKKNGRFRCPVCRNWVSIPKDGVEALPEPRYSPFNEVMGVSDISSSAATDHRITGLGPNRLAHQEAQQ